MLKETKDTHHFLHQDFADKDENVSALTVQLILPILWYTYWFLSLATGSQVFNLLLDAYTETKYELTVTCICKSSSRPEEEKKVNLLKLSVNNPGEQTFTTGTGILGLLHVDYWAYTTKRQLLQLDIQLVFGFNISLLMPKPGLILKLFPKNISFRTVLIRKRKLAPSTSF